jgi:hypothetical protein
MSKRKRARYQNRQGNWRTSKNFVGSRKIPRGTRTRLSKQQIRSLKLQTKTEYDSKGQKTVSDGTTTVSAFGTSIKPFNKKKENYREDLVTYNDEGVALVQVRQREEASKYTPKTTITTAESLPDGSVQISKLGGRKSNERIVSQTTIVLTPTDLEDKFRKWDTAINSKEKTENRLPDRELKTLAKQLQVPIGGTTRPTKEKRIREKLKEKDKFDIPKVETQKKQPIKKAILSANLEILRKSFPNVTSTTGGAQPIKEVYEHLKDKGYSETEIDQNIRELDKEGKIEFQTASDQKLLTKETKNFLDKKGYIIPDIDPKRGKLYYNYLIVREKPRFG